MEPIQLPIVATVGLQQLDAAITRLEELEKRGFSIPVQFKSGIAELEAQLKAIGANAAGPIGQSAQQASTFINSLTTKLRGLGETDAVRQLEGGFKNAAAALQHFDRLYDEMQAKRRAAARNPQSLITGRVGEYEDALNLIALERERLAAPAREAMDQPRDRALFAQNAARTEREGAEETTRAASTRTKANNEARVALRNLQDDGRRHIAVMRAEGATVEQLNAAYKAHATLLDRLALKYETLDKATATAATRAADEQRARGQTALAAAARRETTGDDRTVRQQEASAAALQRQRSAALVREQRDAEREQERVTRQQQSAADALQRQRSAALIRQQRESEGKAGGGGFLSTVGTAATFIGIYRGLDLGIRALENGIESSIQFERKLATLQIVFRGTTSEARELGRAVLDQAAALGQDGIAALDVATDFARYGLNQHEILEAVRVSMVAANVAQLDLGESSKALQSIMSGYGLTVGQLSGVLGSLDTVSHTYNVTNRQLLDGLARVAPLAKQAGISLNELIGFEAVISGTTARPGAEAGNAVKALISRLARPQTETALADYGVSTRDRQTGDLKNQSQLINELFVAYSNLTPAEREEMVVRTAGAMQAGRLTALFDKYLESQRLAIQASLDLTRAERENVNIRESLQSQLRSLQAEWIKFWQAGTGAGESGGVQSAITEGVVRPLESALSIATRTVSILGVLQQLATPRTGNTGVDRHIDDARKDFYGLLVPAYGASRGVDKLADASKQLGIDKYFKSDAEQAADALLKLNKEIDKFQKTGEAEAGAVRQIKTIDSLIDRAPPEKLASYLRYAAQAAAPEDLPRQESLRQQLQQLAQAGDYQALHVRLAELRLEAQNRLNAALARANVLLDQQIKYEVTELASLQRRRDDAAKSNRSGSVHELDQQITQHRQSLNVYERLRQGTVDKLFPEGEDDAYSAQLSKESARAKELAQAQVTLFKTAFPAASHSDEVEREALAIRLSFDLEKQRIEFRLRAGNLNHAEAQRAIKDLEEEKREALELNAARKQAAEIADSAKRATREATEIGKAYRAGGLGSFVATVSGRETIDRSARGGGGVLGPRDRDIVAPGGRFREEERGRGIREFRERREAEVRASFRQVHNETEGIIAEREGLLGLEKRLHREVTERAASTPALSEQARRQMIYGFGSPTETSPAAAQSRYAKEIAAARASFTATADYEREMAQVQASLRQRTGFGPLTRQSPGTEVPAGRGLDQPGARVLGISPAPSQPAQRQVRETVEQVRNVPRREEITRVPLNVPAAREDIERARTQEEKAAAIARLQEFGKRLEQDALDILGRKLTLESEITRERQRQSDEASKNLLLADRETQLRAALASRLASQRGRGFTAEEFGLLDSRDKQALQRTNPNLVPPEAGNRLAELTAEYQSARRELTSYNDTLATARQIQEEATRALGAFLEKLGGGAATDANARPTQPPPVDSALQGISKVLDGGTAMFNTTLERLGGVIESRDRAWAASITALSDRIARSERGGLQDAIGRAQGAAAPA